MTLASKFQPYIRATKQSETLLINQVSLQRSNSGKPVYKFGFGQSPFPVPEKIVASLASSAGRKEYMSVQGDLKLRQSICKFHRHFENKQWSEEQIIVGAGSKILIYCILAAFHNAEVLLPAPSWVSYEPQARLAGHSVNWLETKFEENWRLTPEQLRLFCCQRKDPNTPLILVFNYPSNPTGQTYSSTQLQDLAEVMREFNIIVIADEIYSLLSYERNYTTLEEFYPEGCVVSSGLSKWCGAGGWRLGFIHIPSTLGVDLLQAVVGVASETYSCAPSPIQIAATSAYQDLELAESFLTKQVGVLKRISQYCSQQLRNAGVKVHQAQGGFYLFPEFSNFTKQLANKNIHTSEQLTKKLIQDIGVALLPGTAFGMNNKSLTTRLAFVDFDGSQIYQKSIEEINFEPIKTGIDHLIMWLARL